MVKVGILGFQGDIEEHEDTLKTLNCPSIRVLETKDLNKITHLIIPGGESTSMSKLLKITKLGLLIQKKVKNKKLSIYGTCAGAILLAKKVKTSFPINNLNLINIHIARNAYGRQINSFEDDLIFLPNNKKFKGIFIRAPKILSIGPKVKILVKHQQDYVALEENNVLLSTFHPELINPPLLHEYFLKR